MASRSSSGRAAIISTSTAFRADDDDDDDEDEDVGCSMSARVSTHRDRSVVCGIG
jgi:hypothetical protein